MTSALVTVAPKLQPPLASDRDGEVVATARAIGRTLRQAGADFNDLTATVARAEQPTQHADHGGEPPAWNGIPEGERPLCLARLSASGRLSDWEMFFVASIAGRLRFSLWRRLSPKQIARLDRIARKVSP